MSSGSGGFFVYSFQVFVCDGWEGQSDAWAANLSDPLTQLSYLVTLGEFDSCTFDSLLHKVRCRQLKNFLRPTDHRERMISPK